MGSLISCVLFWFGWEGVGFKTESERGKEEDDRGGWIKRGRMSWCVVGG